MGRFSRAKLEYELAIRGWDQGMLATRAKVSEATVCHAMAGRKVRGFIAVKIAQALRGQKPIPELVRLIPLPPERIAEPEAMP